MKKWQIALKDFLEPLPNPKQEATKFQSHDFKHLSDHQVELVVTMIIKEAQKSRGFGLFIKPKDLESEIIFWLAYLDIPDIIQTIRNAVTMRDYNFLFHSAFNFQEEQFEKAIEYYQKNSKAGSPNAYNCHLQCVQSTIFLAIVNDDFPPTPPSPNKKVG